MVSRALSLLAAALVSACTQGAHEPSSDVEPAIVQLSPSSMTSGSFVLTLFLAGDAEATEVWLQVLREPRSRQVARASSEVAFPIALDPGEFARARIDYTLAGTCEHELGGVIFDSASEELTEVASASAPAPECN
jgi:hypothetical protein